MNGKGFRGTALAAVAVGALALAGCVGFDGKPKGKQISNKKVQVEFTLCRASSTKTCSDQGNTGTGRSRLLIGLRAPRGTSVPTSIHPVGMKIPFEPAGSYARQLTQGAPTRPGFKWFGWISSTRPNETWPDTGDFRIKLGLPNDPGRRFKFRPVVGFQEVPEKGDPPAVDCGDDPFDPPGELVCIDAPDTRAEVRKSLKIKLD